MGSAKCRVCGCTDDRACTPVPCFWVDFDLCSACGIAPMVDVTGLDHLQQRRQPRRRRTNAEIGQRGFWVALVVSASAHLVDGWLGSAIAVTAVVAMFWAAT